MEVDYQPKEGGIELRFEDREGVERFFDEAAETEAFFLDLPGEPRQYQVFRCSVQHGERFRFSFEAEVVQVFPRGDVTGVAFHLKSWNAAKTKELQRLLAAADSDEELGPEVSPIFKIKKLNPNQRFRLAMKASRVERGILLRDTSPEVLAGLLSHPRIEEKEVLEIVKSPYASGGILKRVGDNRKWMHNADIRLAVVKSPKTPTPLAIKHLPTLRTSELRTLAKMGNAREALRKEALKVYLARMGQGSGGF